MHGFYESDFEHCNENIYPRSLSLAGGIMEGWEWGAENVSELACILDALQLLYLRCAMQLRWVGWGVFFFCTVQHGGE